MGVRAAGVAAWQTASGLGNVVLGWPLVAAVAHTAGAAALVVVLTFLIVRARGAAMPSRQWPGRAARDPWLRRMSPLAIPALPLALAALP